ncbi:MAG: hypothetical protein KDB70_04900 [Mycobacterium sp.]|nr:hypothetical protein [Mycobacterium sp.]
MALGYRAIARLSDSEDAIDAAESQLSSWLRGKKQKRVLTSAEWDGEGEYQLGPASQLTVVHDPDRQDGSRRRLYRLREINDAGVWTVSLFAFSVPQAKTGAQTLVVDLDVDAQDVDAAIGKSAPPRLIHAVLDAHEARDGNTLLTSEPRIVRVYDADTVRDAILDGSRTASVIVAPLPWSDQETEWRALVKSLTVQSVGVAATFILDEEATKQLAEGLPPSHTVEPGVIRTFAPSVRLDSPEDGLRHRKLYPGTLMKHMGKGLSVSTSLARRHAYTTRLRFIERDLPADVRRSIDLLQRAEGVVQRARSVERRVTTHREDAPQASSIAPSSAVGVPASPDVPDLLNQFASRWLAPDELTNPDEIVARLHRLMETKSAEASQWEDEFDRIAEQNSRLEAELRDSKARMEDLSYEITDAEDRAQEREREASVLRSRLIGYGQHQLAYVEPELEDWTPPYSIEELVDRITPGGESHIAFDKVVFTGDLDHVLEVDRHEPTPRYAHAFWLFVHVLYDYAVGCANGQIQCGVHLHLKSDATPGQKCSPERHAAGESDTTLNRWSDERIFPVPNAVDQSGKILMAAHFKPTWRDRLAPRMHYYDDTSNTGKVYIGYIGRHLRNTKT